MQTYFNLASARQCVCVGHCKVLFSLFVHFAFMHLLLFVLFCFVLATVHVMNALESNTVYSLQVFFVSWSCLRAVRERGGGRRGGGAQRLPGEEEVVSNEVTPWQPGDSSHSALPAPPSPFFPLGPL